MKDAVRLGKAIKAARDARGLTQPELATAVGIHPMTIAKYEAGVIAVSAARLAVIESQLGLPAGALMATAGEDPGIATYPGSPNVRSVQASTDTPGTWPQDARIFVQEFLLEATKDGANDEELSFIRRTLTSPEAYVMYQGGRLREMTSDEMRMELEGLAAGLRKWLELKIKRRKEALRLAAT